MEESMKRMLDSFAEFGVAAMFYKGDEILMANEPLAELLDRTVDECNGLPIMEICHEESISMIQDFVRRRARGDRDLPVSYFAKFFAPEKGELELRCIVVKMKKSNGAFLVILQEKD